ncbi:alpha/beta fold hydrolase [Microbacterium nymphoidis]|jgi:pimeloyl-ACP methyl ester carboxylesterase|uniref:alpha/beta fold hydrolase n=1 Tax=Microbacterium nymphoidis TaxID=2898586 RepID=UPI001E4F5559|nr:alpha/beta fold hydrolase [Microbacterium nymphoidis]MCD2498768.1 alpha/beta hydrolase [Microbacterium nymphoidis]
MTSTRADRHPEHGDGTVPEPELSESGSNVTTFSLDGRELIAEELAGPESLTFIVVHGFGLGRSAYIEIAHGLTAAGRVIALDLPGFGEAPEPARTPTMEELGDLVAAFVSDRALENVVLIGHSMGTQIVAEAVARHPGSAVTAAVLVAPTTDSGARGLLRQTLRLARDIVAAHPLTFYRGAAEYLKAGPHLMRKARATVVHRPEATYPRMEIPVLVLRGANDHVVPKKWSEKVLALLPDGALTELPGRGHAALIVRPEASVIRIEQFLLERKLR